MINSENRIMIDEAIISIKKTLVIRVEVLDDELINRMVIRVCKRRMELSMKLKGRCQK